MVLHAITIGAVVTALTAGGTVTTGTAEAPTSPKSTSTTTTADGPAAVRTSSTVVSCAAGGFRGWAELRSSFRGSGANLAVDVELVRYKIDKGSNRGGNKANVDLALSTWADPNMHRDYGWRKSTDSKIQDNAWHAESLGLSGHMQPGLRSRAEPLVRFTFDKSVAADPKCDAGWVVWR